MKENLPSSFSDEEMQEKRIQDRWLWTMAFELSFPCYRRLYFIMWGGLLNNPLIDLEEEGDETKCSLRL